MNASRVTEAGATEADARTTEKGELDRNMNGQRSGSGNADGMPMVGHGWFIPSTDKWWCRIAPTTLPS